MYIVAFFALIAFFAFIFAGFIADRTQVNMARENKLLALAENNARIDRMLLAMPVYQPTDTIVTIHELAEVMGEECRVSNLGTIVKTDGRLSYLSTILPNVVARRVVPMRGSDLVAVMA